MAAAHAIRLVGVRGWRVRKPLSRLTMSLADATAADLPPGNRAGHEAAYRRGVHQALAFAGDLVDQAETLGEAECILARAENIAGELRYRRKNEGNMMLLDTIRGRLSGRGRKR
jgi:hypothetical protein